MSFSSTPKQKKPKSKKQTHTSSIDTPTDPDEAVAELSPLHQPSLSALPPKSILKKPKISPKPAPNTNVSSPLAPKPTSFLKKKHPGLVTQQGSTPSPSVSPFVSSAPKSILKKPKQSPPLPQSSPNITKTKASSQRNADREVSKKPKKSSPSQPPTGNTLGALSRKDKQDNVNGPPSPHFQPKSILKKPETSSIPQSTLTNTNQGPSPLIPRSTLKQPKKYNSTALNTAKKKPGPPAPTPPHSPKPEGDADEQNVGTPRAGDQSDEDDEDSHFDAAKADKWKNLLKKAANKGGNARSPSPPPPDDAAAGLPAVPRESLWQKKGPEKAQKKIAKGRAKLMAEADLLSDEDEGDEGDFDEGDEEADGYADEVKSLSGKKKDLFGGLRRVRSEQDVDEGDEGDEGDEDDDFENEELPIEKATKRLEKMKERVERESQLELQTNIQSMQKFTLPSGEEIEKEKLAPPDMSLLNQRIQDILFTLAEFRTNKEEGKSRVEYMQLLSRDLATYYGYLPELIDRFLEMFSPPEAVEFLMANEVQRPQTLRTNTLRTRRADLIQTLGKRSIQVEALAPWTKVGLKVISSKLPIGATPEYLAGHYILQSAASFLPVMALAPQENEKILDMCASPGGKATYIAALMKNTGLVLANDANAKRLASLTGNIHRLGVHNAIVTNFDGRKLRRHFGLFDRILLDAPCSGLGIISKDPSVKLQKTNKDILRASHIQKELALQAIDMLDADSKTGGYLVYSTCSIAVEENEAVVDYVLAHRRVKLVDTTIPFGVVGMTRYRTKQFHSSLSLTRRFYPHVHNMDGFFVAKFKKLGDEIKKEEDIASDAFVPTPTAREPEMPDEQGPGDVPNQKSKKRKITESASPTKTVGALNGSPAPRGNQGLKKKQRAKLDVADRSPPNAPPRLTSKKVTAPRRPNKNTEVSAHVST